MEEWRIVEGFTKYEVSNMGNVRRDGKVLKSCINSHGYLIVGFYKHTRKIHRLVALAFIPNLENKPEIDHIDRNKLNNTVENLRWATHGENSLNRDIPLGVSGYRHISIKRNAFEVRIHRNNKLVYRKCFNNLPEAINARDAFLATL
jgi:hypothetical protein